MFANIRETRVADTFHKLFYFMFLNYEQLAWVASVFDNLLKNIAKKSLQSLC